MAHRAVGAVAAIALVLATSCLAVSDLDGYDAGCADDEVACEGTCRPAMEFKVCDDACVSINDVDYGCTPTSCTRCSFENGRGRCADEICELFFCAPDFDDCDGDPTTGCEANLLADTAHCGACGVRCEVPAGALRSDCDAGDCAVLECEAGRGDCDGRFDNGCEAELPCPGE